MCHDSNLDNRIKIDHNIIEKITPGTQIVFTSRVRVYDLASSTPPTSIFYYPTLVMNKNSMGIVVDVVNKTQTNNGWLRVLFNDGRHYWVDDVTISTHCFIMV